MPEFEWPLRDGKVSLQDQASAADARKHRLGTCLVTTVVNDWMRTVCGKTFDDCGADTDGGPGDQNSQALKCLVHRCLAYFKRSTCSPHVSESTKPAGNGSSSAIRNCERPYT